MVRPFFAVEKGGFDQEKWWKNGGYMLIEWIYDIYLWIKCGKLNNGWYKSKTYSPKSLDMCYKCTNNDGHPQNHQLYGCYKHYKPSLDGRYIFSLGEAHIHPLATGRRFFTTRMAGAVTKGRF
jgi:hypothetical protein